MKKIITILGCVAVLLSACGKKEDSKQTDNANTNQVVSNKQTANGKLSVAEDVLAEDNKPAKPAKYFEDDLTKKIGGNTDNFKKEFAKLDEAQKYYFCAAFAMGAMSAAKPITASVMVTYFMGLGVAKYNVGINDETYMAFNAGKNVFMHENLINEVLESGTCENIINEATDFAVKQKVRISDLDKLGQIEVEKVVKYIQKEK